MNFYCIPVIVVCCYLIGELFKLIFSNKQNTYKYIPIITALAGGLLGVAIFFTNPEILAVDNAWSALGIGIVSGASATGANQIIKQIFTNKQEDHKND